MTSPKRSAMGESSNAPGEEHVARCVALEKAYVHEIYEQLDETSNGPPWPRVQQFIQELEPGSLVCDVGCGSGKYLQINKSVYTVGVDRCFRLAEVAREKNNQVLICDNLSLPFRDESFDAVLSVAVIHHLATRERRVGALRELARLLRIGGKLIISVWAMEQRHRKFESQDVLVPWHRPQHLSSPSLELTPSANTSEEDAPPPGARIQTPDSDSNRSLRHAISGLRKRGRTRHKNPDQNHNSSPGSSSLSSPNETCYSFVRRALQKLAGGRRNHRHRPWFIETWNNCSKDSPHDQHYHNCDDDCEDIEDLPIELRRIEEDEIVQNISSSTIDLYKSGHKSKSLSDIHLIKHESLIRSRSNISNLTNITQNENDGTIEPTTTIEDSQVPTIEKDKTRHRPRLVKQKQSLNEEDGEDLDKPLNQRDVVEALPDFRLMHSHYKRGNVFKQSSMNEELLSTDRLREKESVRKNIQKQASLNEDLIYRRYRTLDSLRDSLMAVSSSKKFQFLKNGFTSKLKNSTTNIEKVASSSIKNGFVRILQGWKSENGTTLEKLDEVKVDAKATAVSTQESRTEPLCERRPSREDGSDSSKDSSLQSDTSVDSEDSFASVIFVPKQDSQELTSPTPLSPAPTSPRIKLTSSGPTSPRLKQSSCPTSPRLKQMPLSVYPLLKQPTSPKTAQQLKQVTGSKVLIYSQSAPFKSNVVPHINVNEDVNPNVTKPEPTPSEAKTDEPTESNTQVSPLPSPSPKEPEKAPESPSAEEEKKTLKANIEKYKHLAEKYKLQPIPMFRSTAELSRNSSSTKIRTDRLQQIRELLNQRPGFGRSHSKSSRHVFPMVRRGSTQIASSRKELVAKSLPRLLSLELFNPETDDMDSDSSGVSSPDSADSVISVEVPHKKLTESNSVVNMVELNKAKEGEEKVSKSVEVAVEIPSIQCDLTLSEGSPDESKPASMSLFEAVANVAQSLDSAVDAVIQSSPRSKRRDIEHIESSRIRDIVSDTYVIPESTPEGIDQSLCTYDSKLSFNTQFTFDKKPEIAPHTDQTCYEHLTEFVDQISEDVLKEIDEYRKETRQHPTNVSPIDKVHLEKFNDPYIHKLSEEIQDLTRLSAELTKERNLYLINLKNNLYESKSVVGSCDQVSKLAEPESNCDNKSALSTSKSCSELSCIPETIVDPVVQVENSSQVIETSIPTFGVKTKSIVAQLLPGLSQESSDTGIITDGGSTASLSSCKDWNKPRFTHAEDTGRSLSEDIPETPRQAVLRQHTSFQETLNLEAGSSETDNPGLNVSLSDTSQESLPSDSAGGSITYHRYYHVFRQGELDNLIERHVENLHIISSYYDQSSWCVVAEKVQVWTI